MISKGFAYTSLAIAGLAIAIAGGMIAGCADSSANSWPLEAASTPPPPGSAGPPAPSSGPIPVKTVEAPTMESGPAPDSLERIGEQADVARLFKLWKERTSNLSSEFPIGPGDILVVSVPAIEELKDRTFRVEGDNTIALPLIGVIQVGGLTEEQARQKLIKALQKYMYNPQVDVFIKEYRSRQVAVEGAVRYPGLITVAGPTDTILDMLSRAGGRTAEAADQVILVPTALNALSIMALADASDQARANGRSVSLPLPFAGTAPPIVIPVGSINLGGNENYLNLPVRPGDVIIVPGGGEVNVIGWVQTPGHIKIVSGMTVLGAIGAAGGPMFAANQKDVHLYRSLKDGSRMAVEINLDKVRTGQQQDPIVMANDVISVPYSSVKIGPYVVYNIIAKVGYGLAIPGP